ncbi:hypothetical protein M407DRAFT_229840 [Tulasnella calospora MUT 4182]|uniref:Uncharacterized protein n=1 Tax=Tulasnella calospora MUT 4182 TaxID=1051891 RepID=A0A0C3QNK9_9AGAM|nr:hypothetical protein M407DRAFT_229840 [Tulasnella calospora MUT 4182]
MAMFTNRTFDRLRYPYIFGRRKTGLASENNLYSNIANSLCQIYLRSPNREFKKAGKTLFQRLAENSEAHCDGSWDGLLNFQTPAGQAVFAQDEVHTRRSLSRENDSEDGIDTEERFKMLISRSLAALYIATVRPGKKDFETLKAESSRSEQHERAVSDEDKDDDLEGEELMDILELDVPSTDTAMDEVKPDGFLTPVPGTPPISFANKDGRRTTNSSPHPSDDFSPLDEDEQGDGTPNSDLETTHNDIFLDDEYHSPDTVEGGSSSDHGDCDLEFLDSPPHFSHSLPVPFNAEEPPDLLFDDSVRIPDWSDINQNGGFSQRDDDYDEANMLDLESPLMTPDDPPLPSLRGSAGL